MFVVCFLWHIFSCRLFNAKSCLYFYIRHIWFANILLIPFLNDPDLIFRTQVIGNDAISLSKEFSGKNGSTLAQRSPTNANADGQKINN